MFQSLLEQSIYLALKKIIEIFIMLELYVLWNTNFIDILYDKHIGKYMSTHMIKYTYIHMINI